MDIEQFREYCLALPHTTEGFPFGEDVLVFKVCEKIFALVGLTNNPLTVNLKCHPDLAILLREEYPDHVRPGYHMNKTHWNTVTLEQSALSGAQLKALTNHSHRLIWQSLTKKQREAAPLPDSELKPRAEDFWEWE